MLFCFPTKQKIAHPEIRNSITKNKIPTTAHAKKKSLRIVFGHCRKKKKGKL